MGKPPLEFWTRDQFSRAVDHVLHNPHAADRTRADIARQLKLRRAQGRSPISLNAGLRRPQDRPTTQESSSTWIASEILIMVVAVTLLGSGLLAGFALALGWIVILGSPAMILLALRGVASTARYRADDRRARQHRCARCDFDLRGLSEPLPPRLLAGETLGTPRCPECGLDWPRLARLPGEP